MHDGHDSQPQSFPDGRRVGQPVMEGIMELMHRRSHDVDVLAVRGRIQAPEAAKLRERIHQLFDEGRYCLVLDLAQLEYIGSSGLRVLVEARKRAREQKLLRFAHGDVRIVHLPQRIKEVFDLTGITLLFPVYDNLEEAVASF